MKFTMYHNFSANVLKYGIEEATKKAKELGFSGVEIFSDDVSGTENAVKTVEEAAFVKEVLGKYGLSVSCYSVYAGIYRNPEGVESLKKQLHIAAALGSPYFHHTLLPWLSLWDGAPKFKEAVDEVLETAVEIADYAKGLGLKCIYEGQGYYVNGVSGFKYFWRRIKKRCANVGICADLGNILFVNDTPERFIKKFSEDICHVHIKDYLLKKSDNSPGIYWLGAKDKTWLRDTMIGSGVVNFAKCIKLLKKNGYNGSFSLENCHPEPYEDGVHQAIDYITKLWEND